MSYFTVNIDSEYRCSSRIFYFFFFQPVQMNIFGNVVNIVHREWVQRDVNSFLAEKPRR